ncbi:MAG: DUF3108 domain-containing protein [Ignavibacteriales bacterium]|nr:DUF3108 domain-containing protein [Ignavibacteriales bacterium]
MKRLLPVLSAVALLFVIMESGSGDDKTQRLHVVRDSAKAKVDILTTHKDSLTSVQQDTLRTLKNTSFSGGEFLKFDIKYGFVTAAEAFMRVVDTVYHARKCFKVVFTMNSKPFFDVFYKVRDRYESIIDSAGLFPWRFEQHIREGGFSKDFFAEFDQSNHSAITTGGKYRIPPYVHDMLSAFYFSRTIDFSDFKPGQKVHLQNFYKDSTYELDVKFRGRQTVEVDVGKFNCIVIEPLAKEGGLFKSEGKVYIWLTDDDLKIPVVVTTKIPIGNVDSELVEYVGIAGPIKAKIPRD